MQLAVESEQLLASLALSPPHTQNDGVAPFSFDAAATAQSHSAYASPKQLDAHITDEFDVEALSPASTQTGERSGGSGVRTMSPSQSSRLYHQHVLHQIAVAATPRPKPALTHPLTQAAPTQPASPTELDFHWQADDMDELLGLPLATLTQSEHLADPSDMLAQLAAEVTPNDEEEQREGEHEGEHTENEEHGTQSHSRAASLPNPISTSGATPCSAFAHPSMTPSTTSLGSLTPSSPQYTIDMSPTSANSFREHMLHGHAFDLSLSPLPEETKQQTPTTDFDSAAPVQPAATPLSPTRSNILLRQRIVGELLSSERSYLQSVDNLIRFFLQPLRTNASLATPVWSIGVQSHHVDALFSNLELIASFNHRLLDDLSAAIQPPDGADVDEWYSTRGPEIGKLFLQFAPFLKMYTAYVNNHERAADLIKHFETNKEFVAFCAKQSASSGASLQSHLIAPIQRVPRYSLLLQELLRKTPQSHGDYAALTRALSLVNHAASHINESVRAQQNRAQILSIQERFGQDVILLSPSRWFVRQGLLTKKGRHSDVEYLFFLFNDLLLYAANASIIGSSLKLHKSIPLDASFSFASLPDEDPDSANMVHNPALGESNPLLAPGQVSSPPAPAVRKESDSSPNPMRSNPSLSPLSVTSPDALVEAPPPNPSRCHRFLIESRERSFVVFAATAALKAQWLQDLQAVTLQIKLNESQRKENVALARAAGGNAVPVAEGRASRSNSLSAANVPPGPILNGSTQSGPAAALMFGRVQPVMEQFQPTSVCTVCSKRCTSFSGRRHCQSCGSICCSRCCRTELFLEWSRRESRVCDRCVDRCKQNKILSVLESARRHSLTVDQKPVLPQGPAPPLPARPPPNSIHPARPTRPSKQGVMALVRSHSRATSLELDAASLNLASAATSASASASGSPLPPMPSLPADVNSDDEPEDLAGILSPKGRSNLQTSVSFDALQGQVEQEKPTPTAAEA